MPVNQLVRQISDRDSGMASWPVLSLTSQRKAALFCHDAFRGRRTVQATLARRAMAPRAPKASAEVAVEICLSLIDGAQPGVRVEELDFGGLDEGT